MAYKITAAYYSPTGGTKAAVLGLSQALALPGQPAELDLSAPGQPCEMNFGPEDLVVFGGPVFGGCLPDPMLPTLRACHGNGALAVAAAVYGNRAFDDALLQLADLLTEQGFTVIAGCGLLARHSLALSVAANRPDAGDLADYALYAEKISRKARIGSTHPLELPGNRPYKAFKKSAVTPVTGEACTNCGLCASQCPVGAIDFKDPRVTDASRCFMCMRCVLACPAGARALPAPVAQQFEAKLAPLAALRKPNQLFV